MRIEPTGLGGLFLVQPAVFADARGQFIEIYQRQRYSEAGFGYDLVQDNHSGSNKGVLRGLHFQVMRPQAQILTVLRGRIFDVAVDLRPKSPTFRRWFGVELGDHEGPRQLCMAPGFAHGYYVLSDVADLHYKVSRFYAPADEGGIVWNDRDIGIAWPSGERRISPRDASFPNLSALTLDQLPHDPPFECDDT